MGEGKVEKRNRPPVSCEPCRTRKLKCSRGLPCDSCVRRGKANICQYASNADRSRVDGKRAPVTDRLRRLESLIATLAEERGTPSQLSSMEQSEKNSVAQSEEPPVAVASQTGYTDSSHWSSILEDIRDIREQLSPADGPGSLKEASPPVLDSPSDSTGRSDAQATSFDLGFGRAGESTVEGVMAGIPSRQICDFLVSHYFQARFTTLPIIHPAKFQEEYEAFWEADGRASPIWTALLFAILTLSAGTTQVRTLGTGPEAVIPSMHEFSRRTQQCLVLGNYTEAEEHAPEALLLHLQSYFLKGKDTNASMWFTSGVLLRLAIRLGYHRDPDKLRNVPNLTPFKAEMRRRVWISIYQLDALMSFQMGLPSMIPLAAVDCKLPSNLEYSDFSPETTELPAARPYTDHTTVLYTIVKNPTLDMFRRVVGHTQALVPPPYQETIALDGMINDAYSGIPEILRSKPISRSLIDGSSLIMRRITIEMLSLKTLIVLHRQHLGHDTNTEVSASHQACLQAALQMLARQVEMDQASQPGGLLHNDRWMISALTANDLILASVIICLDLTIQTRRGTPCACHTDPSAIALETELAAIRRAQKIWHAASAYSSEARVTARALETTIQRVVDYQHDQFSAVPYEDMQRISFNDDAMGAGEVDVTFREQSPNSFHWEFIDNWLLEHDEEMPDLAAWVLDGVV